MKAEEFEGGMAPWVDTKKFREWINSQGVSLEIGERENRTDGEVHYILTYNGSSFEVHANQWDHGYRWQAVIDWVFMVKK